MKKITILLVTIILASCNTQPSCEYSNVTITANIDGQEVNQKNGNDCYTITKEGEGALAVFTVAGSQTAEKFSISYYEEGNNVDMDNSKGDILRFLNVNFGGDKTEWRANQGHTIVKIEKPDTLGFMFSDVASKENSVSGTILFTR